MRTARMATLVVAVAGASAVAAGCSTAQLSSAAPPTVVCGTVLNAGPAGEPVEDVSRGHTTVRSGTVGGRIFLKVAPGCERGALVSFPAAAARLVARAAAEDGELAAVVLEPRRKSFAITVTPSVGARYEVLVRLT